MMVCKNVSVDPALQAKFPKESIGHYEAKPKHSKKSGKFILMTIQASPFPLVYFSIIPFVTIFIIWLMFFYSNAYAVQRNWVSVGEVGNNLWLVDTGTIACKDNLCKARVKIDPAEADEYFEGMHEYDCLLLEYRILRLMKYDANDNITSAISTSELKKKYPIPESVREQLYNLVCKQTNQLQEQQSADDKYIIRADREVQKNVPPLSEKIVSQQEKKEDGSASANSSQPQKPIDTVFTVQVGAFRNASNAESLETALNKRGYNAYIIVSVPEKDEKLYKVCIGKFTEKEEALSLSRKIKKAEGFQTFITLR